MVDAYSDAIADAVVDTRADGTIRLSTLLAATGLFSRKQVKRGQIDLDGEAVRSDHALKVERDAHRLRYRGWTFTVTRYVPLVLAVDKPADVVCSHRDEDGSETIYEWLGPLAAEVEPVGRLDKETTGLLLLTDDGHLNQRLRHPSRGFARVYVADCSRAIAPDAIDAALRDGVVLRDGTRCQPSGFAAEPDGEGSVDEQFRYRVALREGRYHEVRRLVAALGSHVEELRRVQWGPVVLASDAERSGLLQDESIIAAGGGVTQFVGEELEALYRAASLEVPRTRVRISSEAEDAAW